MHTRSLRQLLNKNISLTSLRRNGCGYVAVLQYHTSRRKPHGLGWFQACLVPGDYTLERIPGLQLKGPALSASQVHDSLSLGIN